MNRHKITALAFLASATVAAHAGTVVFHIGDPTRPTAGTRTWLMSTTGSDVSISGAPTTHPTLPDGSQWVEAITGTFNHNYFGAVTGASPNTPAFGTPGGTGMITGTVYWWFEYIPSHPGDTPTWVDPCYADIQIRAKGKIDQIGTSGAGIKPGTSVNVTGGVVGLILNVAGTTVTPSGFRIARQTFTDGSPWNYAELPAGFTFQWDPVLGKWLGNPQILDGAGTNFTSMITCGDNSKGGQGMSFNRDFKVLRVRTPEPQTFTFNAPWL